MAKVDRLTRSVAFLSRLLEAGVDVRFADLPMIEGATGKFLLQQMAAVAELEAGMISARTKAALAAAKRRGVKLGGDRGARLTAKARAAGRAAVQVRARNRALDLAPTIQELQAAGCASLRALAAAKRRGVKLGGDRGARLTAKARAAGRAALQARARNRALDLAPTIQELQAAGCESLRAIAAGLEERGIPAPRGGKWSAVQVARLLEAAAVPFDANVGAAEEGSNTLRLVNALPNQSEVQLMTIL